MSAAGELMPDGSARSGLSQSVVSDIVRERADALAEVERLREELRIAQFDASVARSECDMAIASATQRLRSSLQRIANLSMPYRDLSRSAQHIAREALKGTEEEPSP